jgi:predicted nucleotidyltransferase
MSTDPPLDKLSATLFGKTRRAVLGLLYGHSDQAFYLRQIVRLTGVGLGAVQRELEKLSSAGIIRRTQRGNQVYFEARAQCPVFKELKNLITKTVGVGQVLKQALAPLSNRIDVAFVYGSVARGEETRTSDIDLLVIGDATFADVVSALGGAQEALHREVNPAVFPTREFKTKLAGNDHFLRSVMEKQKLFLIGDEHELERLAQERVGHRTKKQPG